MGVVEGREGDATCIALTRIWLCASSDTPSSRASDSPPACQISPETNSPDAVESLDQSRRVDGVNENCQWVCGIWER